MNREKYHKLVEEVCPESCKGYCFFKMFFEMIQRDPRTIIQLKCIEKFKWEVSEKEQKDIGWEESIMKWTSDGYAKKFAEIYNEDLSVKEIYKLTMN